MYFQVTLDVKFVYLVALWVHLH